MAVILLAPVAPNFKTEGISVTVNFVTQKAEAQSPQAAVALSKIFSGGDSFWECKDWIDIPCGLAKALYNLVFQPLSYLAGLAGQILDFFVYYSTNSNSYSSPFIGKAWGAVRDIANVFFIVALLYVAIKTILGLGAHGKKMIAHIVIVALLINFSLFFTQVIIDSTNILARVFYNHITVENQDPNIPQKSISVGLVKQFNPQKIFEDVGIKKMANNIGLFALITMILSALCGFMIFMFLSVALLFVGRVAGLWIAMVFAPLAFASYTVPFDIPGFGHKKWWDDLLKQSFMAPIFIFFLYVIYLFSTAIGSAVKDIVFKSTDELGGSLNAFMKIIIPFAIIFILLQQAKKLAVDYSGQIGGMLSKIGNAVGGLALGGAIGAATGGVALLGRGVVGGGVSKIMGKYGERLRNAGVDEEGKSRKGVGAYFSRLALKTASGAQKATYDVRQTKAGKAFSSATGLNLQSANVFGLGSQQGGLAGAQARHAESLKKESDLYRTKMSDDEVKEWSNDRLIKYYKDRSAATDKDAFDAKTPKPKTYTTAKELNVDRLNAFKDNLGHVGALGTLAYETVKRGNAFGGIVDEKNYKKDDAYNKMHREQAEKTARLTDGVNFDQKTFDATYKNAPVTFDAKIAKKVNDEKINKTKTRIGGTAAVLVGAATGGAASAMGIVGSGVVGTSFAGGVIGGGAAFGQHVVEEGGEHEIGSKLGKETKKLERLNSETKRLTQSIDRLNQIIKEVTEKATTAGKPLDDHITERLLDIDSKLKGSLSQQQKFELITEKNKYQAVRNRESSLAQLENSLRQVRKEEEGMNKKPKVEKIEKHTSEKTIIKEGSTETHSDEHTDEGKGDAHNTH